MDRYALTARVTPAAIVLLPLIVAISVWAGGSWPLKIVVGTICWTALAFLASQIARDEGKRREPTLWQSWGGRPTTRLLRHSDRTLPRPVQRRYHEKLGTLVPNVMLPTEEEEGSAPATADAMYESCVIFLLERTRDTKAFALLFSENIAYGFRRNLWGMKPAGVALAIAGLAAVTVKLCYDIAISSPAELLALDAAALLLLSLLLAIWIVRVTPAWVRRAAEAYGLRLLSACDVL